MKPKSAFDSLRLKTSIVAAVAAAVLALWAPTAAGQAGPGQTATNFCIVNHATDKPLCLSDYQGCVVVLDFWAYWCEYCQAAAKDIEPNLTKMFRAAGGNTNGVPVQVISVSIDCSDAALENAYIAQYGLELVADDCYWAAYDEWNYGGIPQFAVINGATNSTNYSLWEVVDDPTGYLANYTVPELIGDVNSVQTQAPVITITNPVNGAAFTSSNVTIAARISTSGKIIKGVAFYQGTTPIGSVTNTTYLTVTNWASAGLVWYTNYSLTWSNVPAGSQTVFARAFYGAGQYLDSAPVGFTVQAPSPPACTLTAPTNGAVVPPPNVTLAANVVSNGMSIQAVVFYYLSNHLGFPIGTSANPPYSATWSGVTPGVKNVFAVALYGEGQFADSPTVTFTVAAPIRQSLSRQGGHLLLSWTGGAGTFQVQTCTNLAAHQWQNAGATTTATNLTITPANNRATFYRIQQE